MTTDYNLGQFGEDETPDGKGTAINVCETNGLFDVFSDVVKSRVDFDAWDNAVRVMFWEKLTPQELASVGVNIIKAAFTQLNKEDQKNVLKLI